MATNINPTDLIPSASTPAPKPTVTPSPQATALAGYIDAAHKNGYGNLDPSVLIATSTGATNHPTHNGVMGAITSAAANAWKSVGHFFSDPSTKLPPNTAQTVSDHFNNTGIQTFKPIDLQTIQKNLQSQGYATKLQANGVWGSDWSNEAYNLTSANLTKQSKGTFSARKVFDGIFGPSFLSHAIPLVASMAKTAVGEAIHTVGLLPKLAEQTQSILPWAAKTPDNISTNIDKLGHSIDAASRLIEHQKAQTIDEYLATPVGWQDALAVVDTALTASVVGKGLEGAALAVKSGLAAGKEAGATNVVTALTKDLGKAAAERPNKWLINSLFPESQAGFRRLPFTNSLLNSPTASFANTLGHIGESIATGGTNMWKAARTVAATPYRLPIVGIAGKIGTDVAMTGLKLGLISDTQKFLGDPNGQYAYALDHLKPIAGLEGTALDLLQLGFHAPHYDINGFASHQVGTTVEGARQTLEDALQQNSIRADWQRGTNTDYTKLVDEAKKRGIPADIVDYGILNNYHEFAARHAAESQYQFLVQNGKIDPTKDDLRTAFLEQTSNAIRNNKDLMNQAVESYKLKPGLFAADLARQTVNMKADKTYDYRTSFLDKLKRDQIIREQIVPYIDHLVTPDTLSKNALNPQVAPLPYGYSSYVDTIQKEYEAAQQKEAIAHNAAADVGLVKKGVVQRVSKKALDNAKDPKAKVKIQNQLDAQNAWDKATAERAAVAKKLAKANKKAVAKVPYPITDAQAAALNGDTLIPSIGHMNTQRQTSGDMQSQALKFYKDLAKAKPGFKAPTTIDIREEAQSARVTNPEDVNPWDLNASVDPTAVRTMAKKLPRSFDPGTASESETILRNKVLGYLGSELNVNIKDLLYVPTENLIDLVVQRSSKAAGDITIPLDAPQALHDGVATLNALGGKLVYGTDIGHAFNYTPKDITELGDIQSRISHYSDKLGLNFAKVDPTTAAKHSYSVMLGKIQEHLNNSPIGTYPVWATAPRLMNYLNSIIKPEMNALISTQYKLTATKGSKFLGVRGFSKQVDALIEENPELTRNQAKAHLQDTLQGETGPQFWTRKQVVQALTKKSTQDNGLIKVSLNGKVIEVEPITVNGAPISTKQANEFYNAMRKGMSATPNYVGGFNPFVKMLDSSLYMGGLPLYIKGHQVLDFLPAIKNQIMAFRYQGSPRFAYLRVLKAAIKGVTENVPFSMNPMESLKATGNYDKAMKLRESYLGVDTKAQQVSDYVNSEFDKADIYNVYNPTATEAWILYNLHKDALAAVGGVASKVDKAAVMKKFDDIYSYGNRTAAEKTVNAFFFPFSFEKTVARQLGGHLLDSPTSRLVAAQAVNLYDNHEQDIKDWYKKHAPIIKEFEKFNPFFHGIGLGNPGGILAGTFGIAKQAFVTLMQPHAITDMASAQAAVNMIPVLKDLNNIIFGISLTGAKPSGPKYGELAQTINAARGDISKLVSGSGKVIKIAGVEIPTKPNALSPYDQQQTDGWALYQKLTSKVANVLAANRNGGNIAWPSQIPGEGGKKVSMQGIRNIVNFAYPSWDSAKMQEWVAIQTQKVAQERAAIQKDAPHSLALYDAFIKQADTIRTVISKQTVDPILLAKATNEMRSAALKLSYSDSTFYTFYKKYYESKFGPLKEL
jgi:hypothetical protein